MKTALATLWARVDGKKSVSGALLTAGALAGYRLGLLDENAAGGLLLTGLTALAAGLTHKAVKRRRRKKVSS